MRPRSRVGDRFELGCGPIGHGGFVVGRHEGVVVFVRHALPGERVRVVVTEGEEDSRFLRADVVEVLEASPDRVVPPCRYAGACGGCDFQHVALPAQRELKAAVVAEQLSRLAGLEVSVTVEEAPGTPDGLGWRTRIRFAVSEGRPGLRRHRSHDLVALDECLLATGDLPAVLNRSWPDASSVEAIVSSTGEGLVLVDGVAAEGTTTLHERVDDRVFTVSGSVFWQVHPAAAAMLRAAVMEAVGVTEGGSVLDLYAGVGLFAEALGRTVGPNGRVVAVEVDPAATHDALTNLAGLPWVEVVTAPVDRFLRGAARPVDVVVLDPPRTGAKRRVVEGIVALDPRVVAYVACDPATLSRDVAIFGEHGYRLDGLRAFDLFPMTHHVECLALLAR